MKLTRYERILLNTQKCEVRFIIHSFLFYKGLQLKAYMHIRKEVYEEKSAILKVLQKVKYYSIDLLL